MALNKGCKAKQYYILPGLYGEFNRGKKAKGLHLNRVIRDVLRQCGYPCLNCNESDCSCPEITLEDRISQIVENATSGSTFDCAELASCDIQWTQIVGAPTIPAPFECADLVDCDIQWSQIVGAPNIPEDVSDLTDTTGLLVHNVYTAGSGIDITNNVISTTSTGVGPFVCSDLQGCNVSLLTNDANYITDVNLIEGSNITITGNITDGYTINSTATGGSSFLCTDLNSCNLTDLGSRSYNDLQDLPIIPDAFECADLNTCIVSDLSDVNITNPVDGQQLVLENGIVVNKTTCDEVDVSISSYARGNKDGVGYKANLPAGATLEIFTPDGNGVQQTTTPIVTDTTAPYQGVIQNISVVEDGQWTSKVTLADGTVCEQVHYVQIVPYCGMFALISDPNNPYTGTNAGAFQSDYGTGPGYLPNASLYPSLEEYQADACELMKAIRDDINCDNIFTSYVIGNGTPQCPEWVFEGEYNPANDTWNCITTVKPNSGVYTPTLQYSFPAVENVTQSLWSRQGNIVTVTGGFSLSGGSMPQDINVAISLPVASNFTQLDDVRGTVTIHDQSTEGGITMLEFPALSGATVEAELATDQISIKSSLVPTTAQGQTPFDDTRHFDYSIQYVIK